MPEILSQAQINEYNDVGAIVVRDILSPEYLVPAGDHRVMTGAGGAQVLEQLNGLLQHPIALVAGSVPDGSMSQGKTDNKKGNAP